MISVFGPTLLADGTARFRLWAPAQARIGLAIEGQDELAMHAVGKGWHECVCPAQAGTRYRFVLEDGLRVPDPASRFQPDDVHGPSELVDPTAYQWRDGHWRGRPWAETVLYESALPLTA
jgi:maltooligosyltrehalose trehalohydrolase